MSCWVKGPEESWEPVFKKHKEHSADQTHAKWFWRWTGSPESWEWGGDSETKARLPAFRNLEIKEMVLAWKDSSLGFHMRWRKPGLILNGGPFNGALAPNHGEWDWLLAKWFKSCDPSHCYNIFIKFTGDRLHARDCTCTKCWGFNKKRISAFDRLPIQRRGQTSKLLWSVTLRARLRGAQRRSLQSGKNENQKLRCRPRRQREGKNTPGRELFRRKTQQSDRA